MDVLELTTLQRRIFRELCRSAGEPLTKAELARRIGATPAGVAKALKSMDELVSYDERHGMVLVSLARTRTVRGLKRVENLAQVYASGLYDELLEAHPDATLVLFGSYARGEDTVRSDVDIAVIGSVRDVSVSEDVENYLRRVVNVSRFARFEDVPTELREGLWVGIVLEGGVEQ